MTETVANAEEFWEDFYRDRAQIWTGNPNPLLVREVAELPPGPPSTWVVAKVPTRSGWPSAAGRSPRSISPRPRWSAARGGPPRSA